MKDTHQLLKEYGAKRQKESIKARKKSKKPLSASEFLDLATETADFTKNQEKARKNALKVLNDTELARRSHLYPPKKTTDPVPNPNVAFRRKRAQKKVNSAADYLTRLRDTEEYKEAAIKASTDRYALPWKDSEEQEMKGNTPWPEDQD